MRLGDPAPRRRNPSLLPLVDVIFLLLIFFMFSSNLSPFSLIELTRDRSGEAAVSAELPQSAPAGVATGVDVIITVSAGSEIRVNGAPIPLERLAEHLTEMRQAGAETVVVDPRAGSDVQGLVTALEAARGAALPFVTIRQ